MLPWITKANMNPTDLKTEINNFSSHTPPLDDISLSQKIHSHDYDAYGDKIILPTFEQVAKSMAKSIRFKDDLTFFEERDRQICEGRKMAIAEGFNCKTRPIDERQAQKRAGQSICSRENNFSNHKNVNHKNVKQNINKSNPVKKITQHLTEQTQTASIPHLSVTKALEGISEPPLQKKRRNRNKFRKNLNNKNVNTPKSPL